jgi:hypothetical protein
MYCLLLRTEKRSAKNGNLFFTFFDDGKAYSSAKTHSNGTNGWPDDVFVYQKSQFVSIMEGLGMEHVGIY